ncbi:MAG TPA: Xaa-Pro peptidase family protein [Gemmatimonadaceae bacterium]|nr:Xaa-Pro peptidase family protein [Gemmatimonadaceae bacterium]
MKRRSFVSSVSLLGAGAALDLGHIVNESRDALAAPRVPTLPKTNITVKSSYAPIPPLDNSVYARRLDRARQLTRDAGGTLLLATSGATNFTYLVGSNYGRSERLIALLLPVNGAPVFIAPSFEVERVRRGSRIDAPIRGWEEQADPFALVRDAIRESGAEDPLSIVVEPKTDYWTAMAIARALPDLKLIDGSGVFEQLRLVKMPEEITRMRRAIEITEDSIASTFDRLEVGMRDRDVAKIVAEEHAKRGIDGGGLVQFGAQSALPHGGTVGTKLAPQTVVLIDAGGEFQGYTSDITRTRWFGDAPPARFREVYNLVHDAQDAAMSAVRPGVPAQEIDRAARAVITKGGYGQYFTHRLGHGMGMDGHEPTWMVEGNTKQLESGYVFSVEPGIYMPGMWGVRIEDDYMCTESGGELLSRRAPKV